MGSSHSRLHSLCASFTPHPSSVSLSFYYSGRSRPLQLRTVDFIKGGSVSIMSCFLLQYPASCKPPRLKPSGGQNKKKKKNVSGGFITGGAGALS